jgi:multidrug resistance protein MdtO
MALAFYFVNLQDFRIQTDLTIGRDRVVGALLGILAMSFIFDRFGTKSDAEQLQKLLVRNTQMLAQLAVCAVIPEGLPHSSRCSEGEDCKANAASEVSRLRSQINDNFANLESQMDAVRFEFQFRHRRVGDLAECERIQRVQPALRSIYLLELTLWSHRARRHVDSGLTQAQNQALDDFLKQYSDELMHLAAWIMQEENAQARTTDSSIRLLPQVFGGDNSPNSQAIGDICQKMVSSLRMAWKEC